MATETHSYTISTDFPNGIVATDALKSEIEASSIVTALDGINTSGDTCDVIFKAPLSAADKTTLDNDASPPTAGSIIGDHQGVKLAADPEVVQLDGPLAGKRSTVSLWPTEGTRTTIISPNWCDRTTWYNQAVRVVDEVLTDSGDQLNYDLPGGNKYLVDVFHGKITQEDSLLDDQGFSCRCVVKVNDVAKTEQDPHVGSGGDYTIDYSTGRVTFLSALQVSDEVKMTYHYENGSRFVIKPAAGKKLKIRSAEVQFSDDIVLADTVIFQAYGLVEVFAPQLTPSPYPAGTLIPLGNATKYKTMMDYMNEANGVQPQFPSLGGAGWRGNSQPLRVLPWDYSAMTELVSSDGMEIRIELEHNVEFGGTAATATFYCLSEDE